MLVMWTDFLQVEAKIFADCFEEVLLFAADILRILGFNGKSR